MRILFHWIHEIQVKILNNNHGSIFYKILYENESKNSVNDLMLYK